jgi:3-hydroxybutyryl-CoA dehydratase
MKDQACHPRRDRDGPVSIPITMIRIGDRASFARTLTEADAYQFSGIIGNFNPIHVNKEFAAKTAYGQRVIPSMLVTSMASRILGTQLPGNGTVNVSQEMEFLAPVFFGDTLECTVIATRIDGKRGRVWFDIACVNQRNELVAKGETEVIPPDVAGGDQ